MKCEGTGSAVPCHQVISTKATWLDLISPGFVLCMASTCPPWNPLPGGAGLAAWTMPRQGPKHSPFLSNGEERAAVPQPRDLVEGGSPAGIGSRVRDKDPQAGQGGQGEGGQRGTAELCGQCPSP